MKRYLITLVLTFVLMTLLVLAGCASTPEPEPERQPNLTSDNIHYHWRCNREGVIEMIIGATGEGVAMLRINPRICGEPV